MTERSIEFAIIGAAKSASTWLHLALRQHPSVYMPASETAFFEDPYYDARDLSPLHAVVNAAPASTHVGIKCPNYLCTPDLRRRKLVGTAWEAKYPHATCANHRPCSGIGSCMRRRSSSLGV